MMSYSSPMIHKHTAELEIAAEQSHSRIQSLISILEGGEEDKESKNYELTRMKNHMDSLMSTYFESHMDLDSEMKSLLDNMRKGLVTYEEFELMLTSDSRRSGLISKMAGSLKSQLENLFSDFSIVLEKVYKGEPFPLNDASYLLSNMSTVLDSVNFISKVSKSSASQLHQDIRQVESDFKTQVEVVVTRNKRNSLSRNTNHIRSISEIAQDMQEMIKFEDKRLSLISHISHHSSVDHSPSPLPMLPSKIYASVHSQTDQDLVQLDLDVDRIDSLDEELVPEPEEAKLSFDEIIDTEIHVIESPSVAAEKSTVFKKAKNTKNTKVIKSVIHNSETKTPRNLLRKQVSRGISSPRVASEKHTTSFNHDTLLSRQVSKKSLNKFSSTDSFDSNLNNKNLKNRLASRRKSSVDSKSSDSTISKSDYKIDSIDSTIPNHNLALSTQVSYPMEKKLETPILKETSKTPSESIDIPVLDIKTTNKEIETLDSHREAYALELQKAKLQFPNLKLDNNTNHSDSLIHHSISTIFSKSHVGVVDINGNVVLVDPVQYSRISPLDQKKFIDDQISQGNSMSLTSFQQLLAKTQAIISKFKSPIAKSTFGALLFPPNIPRIVNGTDSPFGYDTARELLKSPQTSRKYVSNYPVDSNMQLVHETRLSSLLKESKTNESHELDNDNRIGMSREENQNNLTDKSETINFNHENQKITRILGSTAIDIDGDIIFIRAPSTRSTETTMNDFEEYLSLFLNNVRDRNNSKEELNDEEIDEHLRNQSNSSKVIEVLEVLKQEVLNATKVLDKDEYLVKLLIHMKAGITNLHSKALSISHELERGQLMSTHLMVLSEVQDKDRSRYVESLMDMFRIFGHVEIEKLWTDIQLSEYRCFYESWYGLNHKDLLLTNKELNSLFQDVYKLFLETQGYLLNIQSKLDLSKANCKRFNLLTLPQHFNINEDNKNNKNQRNGNKELQLLQDIEDLNQENQSLKSELLNLFNDKSNHIISSTLLFYSILEDTNIIIPSMQQLLLQLKLLKPFVSGSEHMDFITLRQRIDICINSAPSLYKLLHRYEELYQRWVHNRMKAMSRFNLTGGIADASFVCPLCHHDGRHQDDIVNGVPMTNSSNDSIILPSISLPSLPSLVSKPLSVSKNMNSNISKLRKTIIYSQRVPVDKEKTKVRSYPLSSSHPDLDRPNSRSSDMNDSVYSVTIHGIKDKV